MAERVECEICLEECQKDELEEHREMCTARLMFRCSICAGDYVSKEGLWNHLDLHEVADESKELHCQEVRATYKLHLCSLCNDQRGYHENLYWQHVHEYHDGLFQRYSRTGESFRSQTVKTDHDLTHCQAKEQMVADGLEVDQKSSSIVLPMHVKNTASLLSCGDMNENAATQLESSIVELSNVSEEDSKCFDIDIVIQQGTLVPEKNNEDSDIDSRLSDISSTNSIVAAETDNNMADKESIVFPIASSKNRSKTKSDVEKISQSHVENPSDGSTDTKCSHCGKEFSGYVFLARHIELHHKPHTCEVCGIAFPTVFKARYHKIMNHMKLKHKCPYCSKLFHREKEHRIHLSTCKNRKFSCELCHQKFKTSKSAVAHVKKVHKKGASKKVQIDRKGCKENQELYPECSSVNGSGQSSALSQEKSTGACKETVSPNTFTDTGLKKVDSRLIEHSPVNSNSASNTNNVIEIKTKMQPTTSMADCSGTKVTTEKALSPVVENLLSGPPDTKCTHCGKRFSSFVALARHIEMNHMPHACDICGVTFPTIFKARYHKITKHTEAKHKCPHCPKTFHQRKKFRTHLSYCENLKFSCELCGQKFKASESVVGHMTQVHKVQGMLKEILIDHIGCNEEHEQNQAEQITVKKENSVEETTSNPFAILDCPICGEHFGNQIQVSHHVEANHQMTMCASCGITFASNDKLNDHKLTCPQHLKHIGSQSRTEEILQPHGETSSSRLSDTVCPHCDKDCSHETLLARHIAWCHQPVVCETCGITVSGKNRISYHMTKYHSVPKLNSPHCPKIVSTKVKYMRHVSKYVKDGKFACKLCDRMYKNALALNDHIRRVHSLKGNQTGHTDRNELDQEHQPCDNVNLMQCEDMELKMEIKVEETTLQEQEYKAPDDDRGQSPTITIMSASQMTVHKSDMERERKSIVKSKGIQRKCSICGVTVASAVKLRYHKLKYHTERKFKCPDCPRKFIFEGFALAHMGTHKGSKSKHPILLQAHIKHPVGDNSKGADNENEIKIKEETLEENTLTTTQSSTESLQSHEVLSKQKVSDEAIGQMEACSICGETFENRPKMKYHMQVSHTERTHKCSVCPLSFHYSYMLRRHEKLHKKTACKLCSEKFLDELCLERHLSSAHSNAELLCNKCNLSFDSHHKFNDHMKRFHTELSFKCQHCGKQYKLEHSLRNHMAIHLKTTRKRMKESSETSKQLVVGDSAQNQNLSFQNVESEHLDHETEIKIEEEDQSDACSICGINFKNRRKFEYHKLVTHTEPQHKCSLCPKMFHLMSVLRRHEATHNKTLEAEGSLVCDLCPLKFSDEDCLQRHIVNVHPATEMSCGMCDLKFTTRYKLHYHMKKLHTEPGLKCPDCGKLYNMQNALRRHMAVHLKAKQQNRMKEGMEVSEQHNDDKLEQDQNSSLQNVKSDRLDYENETDVKEDKSKACSICGLIIFGDMKHHKRTAHIDPKYKCSHCPKMFHSIPGRDSHETTHSKAEAECKVCAKTFQGECSLQRHVKLAHPPSELPCDMCDLKFPTHPKLYYHVKTIHSPRFKCPECDKSFYAPYALKNHMDVHSKITEKK